MALQKDTITAAELEILTKMKEFVPRDTAKPGDRSEDVRRLQKYLSEFGYLESEKLDRFAVTGRIAVAQPDEPGTFDEKTSTALRRFQEFNHLPVTGVLDQATLGLMTKPRCGFPDTAEFVAQGNRWGTTNLTYGFQEFTPDLTPAQVRAAIAQALGLWSAVTPLRFTEVPIANNPDIRIRFVSGDHGDGSNFDGASGILAHAFYPPPNGGDIAGDTHFDEAETWSVNLPASGIDLMTVAGHEFGHALGLAHSNVTGALMYAFYGGPHRNLETDDIQGIQSIYGAPGVHWQSLGGVITSNIAVARNADGRLEIFARGTDNALWHKWQTAPNGGWSGWASLGGVITSDPVLGMNADGRLEVFARGTDQAVWHMWQTAPNSAFSGWSSLGGVITSNIAVARNLDGRMEIFARGTDNALWHRWQTAPNSAFAGWSSLGGVITSDPIVVPNADGRLDALARGTDNAVWHRVQTAPNSAFAGWGSLGGVITSMIAAGRNLDGRLEIFARGTDNAVWTKTQVAANGAYGGWWSLGGVITSNIAVGRNADGRLEIFARGTDNALWHKWQTAANNGWSGWETMGGVINLDPKVGSNLDGRMEVFVRGTDGAVWHSWQTSPSNGWN
jgi:acylphosphatase/peptidoglycan hydrolase-like protein with peptidoglycan-binding domain